MMFMYTLGDVVKIYVKLGTHQLIKEIAKSFIQNMVISNVWCHF